MNTDIKLPMPAEQLVPHRPPFLFVDNLLEFSGQTGVVESVIAPDNLFIAEDGHFKEIAMIEILAQSVAAVKGYSDLIEGKEIKKGFLVDIREFNFIKTCYKGDTIRSKIVITRSFSGFSVLDGSLECSGEELAYGTMKLWVPEDDGE
jgi:predicted hotdog family 3-hydroxylacyl-ACP dehydratase